MTTKLFGEPVPRRLPSVVDRIGAVVVLLTALVA